MTSRSANENKNTVKIISETGEDVGDLTINSLTLTYPKISIRKRLRLKHHNRQEQDND